MYSTFLRKVMELNHRPKYYQSMTLPPDQLGLVQREKNIPMKKYIIIVQVYGIDYNVKQEENMISIVHLL